jgi:thymidine kinase
LEPELVRRQSGLEVSTVDAEIFRDAVGNRRSVGNVPSRKNRRESYASDIGQDQYSQFDYGIEGTNCFSPYKPLCLLDSILSIFNIDNAQIFDKSFNRISEVFNECV